MSTTDNPSTVPTAATSSPVTVVRSEEQLAIATTVQVRGAVRLHKRIITETVTQTVEVSREELIVTELAPDEISMQATLAAADGAHQLREREFDVILHQERVVVTTEVVPVERVRVRVHVVTEQAQVVESLRREHIGLLDESVTPPPT